MRKNRLSPHFVNLTMSVLKIKQKALLRPLISLYLTALFLLITELILGKTAIRLCLNRINLCPSLFFQKISKLTQKQALFIFLALKAFMYNFLCRETTSWSTLVSPRKNMCLTILKKSASPKIQLTIPIHLLMCMAKDMSTMPYDKKVNQTCGRMKNSKSTKKLLKVLLTDLILNK